jgi:hypothetical protein
MLLEKEAGNILAQLAPFILRKRTHSQMPGTRRRTTESNEKASTPQLDRLERLANAAATAAQAKQWQARKNGLHQQEQPAEVRDLSHNDEARARAEEAMRQMMAMPHSKRRGW